MIDIHDIQDWFKSASIEECRDALKFGTWLTDYRETHEAPRKRRKRSDAGKPRDQSREKAAVAKNA